MKVLVNKDGDKDGDYSYPSTIKEVKEILLNELNALNDKFYNGKYNTKKDVAKSIASLNSVNNINDFLKKQRDLYHVYFTIRWIYPEGRAIDRGEKAYAAFFPVYGVDYEVRSYTVVSDIHNNLPFIEVGVDRTYRVKSLDYKGKSVYSEIYAKFYKTEEEAHASAKEFYMKLKLKIEEKFDINNQSVNK